MENSTAYYYSTVSEAVTQLQNRGYSFDFNLKENIMKLEAGAIQFSDFDIVEVYRYEGNSDPGDEAIVYAIESKSGLKGLMVTGFGISANGNANKILSKMHFHQK